MVDPSAPSNTRGMRRAPSATPGAASWATSDHPERDPLRDGAPRPAEVRRNDAPPATPGLFWIVAAIGIGLLCLANLVHYFAVLDDLPDEQVAPALFAVLGLITLAAGLTLAALLQRAFTIPWRIALLLGAGYFALQGAGWMAFVGSGLFP